MVERLNGAKSRQCHQSYNQRKSLAWRWRIGACCISRSHPAGWYVMPWPWDYGNEIPDLRRRNSINLPLAACWKTLAITAQLFHNEQQRQVLYSFGQWTKKFRDSKCGWPFWNHCGICFKHTTSDSVLEHLVATYVDCDWCVWMSGCICCFGGMVLHACYLISTGFDPENHTAWAWMSYCIPSFYIDAIPYPCPGCMHQCPYISSRTWAAWSYKKARPS